MIDKEAAAMVAEDRMFAIKDSWCEETKEAARFVNDDFMAIANAIRQLPDEDEWIPVEDELPSTDRAVLITCKDSCGDTEIRTSSYFEHMFSSKISFGMRWDIPQYYRQKDVIAWRELPEPYREAEPHEID